MGCASFRELIVRACAVRWLGSQIELARDHSVSWVPVFEGKGVAV